MEMVSKVEEEKRRRHRIEEYWQVGGQITSLEKREIGKKAEDFAETALKELGFTYVLALNNSMRYYKKETGRFRKTFPFDFYCEKDGQKWFIEVTTYVKKDILRSPLWNKLGIKISVLFVRRDLQEYCLKKATNRVSVCLCLKDVGLKPISGPERAKRAWETRRKNIKQHYIKLSS